MRKRNRQRTRERHDYTPAASFPSQCFQEATKNETVASASQGLRGLASSCFSRRTMTYLGPMRSDSAPAKGAVRAYRHAHMPVDRAGKTVPSAGVAGGTKSRNASAAQCGAGQQQLVKRLSHAVQLLSVCVQHGQSYALRRPPIVFSLTCSVS